MSAFTSGPINSPSAGSTAGAPSRRAWRDRVPLPAPCVAWLSDPTSRRACEWLLALWVLALADLFFTIWAHRLPRFRFGEMNPIAAAMLGRGLVASLVIFKLTVTLLATDIFWRLRIHRRARAALVAMVVVYVLLAMRWSEYTTGAAASVLTTVPAEQTAV